MANSIEVFFSYAHADEAWRDKLERHLSSLKRQRFIKTWHDRKINPGSEWASEIDTHLKTADIILLLISADFIASEYCWSVELKQAIKRHRAGEARVIPIIVHPVDWHQTAFARLQALPTDGKAISTWSNVDEALARVATGIRAEVEAQRKKRAAPRPATVSRNDKPGIPEKKTPSLQVWTIPFRRNPFFTGRKPLLNRVYSLLHAGTAAALSQPPAISGLGGIGKTQLALEYAYRYRQEYQAVLWVRSDSREELLADMMSIAGRLNLPEKDAQDSNKAVQAVKSWLETHKDWLLIFDNADDLTLIQDYMSLGTSGHILLTTRAQVMSGLARKIDITTMEPDEGALFLLRRAGLIEPEVTFEQASEPKRAQAVALVEALDGLPLALDQAGAYLEETGDSLSNYLALYRKERVKLLKRRGGLNPDHPTPVAATWSLSIAKVAQASPAAVELLQFCAFLAADAIPEEILTEGATELGPVLQPVAADPVELNAAIGALLKYSLLRRDSTLRMLTIHRLVQAVIKDELDPQNQRQWAERAVQAVYSAFPDVKFENWSLCDRFLPHLLVCATLITQWELLFPEAARLLNQAGLYLVDRLQYQEAESLYQQVVAIHERALGSDEIDTATILDSLALLYWEQGKNQQAEPLYQQTLTIRERVQGVDHPETARTLNNLALLYWNQGKYEQAEPLYQRALTIHEKSYGPDHPDVARDLNNLALLYADQGKYEQAEALYQRALTIKERALGGDHPDTATTLNNLAILYWKQGKYEQAEVLYQRALTIDEKSYGSDHPEVAMDLNNLANLYAGQGKYEQAEPFYQRALTIDERVLGADHPETKKVRKNYADFLQERKREAEADDPHEEG